MERKGAQEGRAYSQRSQLEVSSQDAAAAPLAHVVLDLRARRRRRASVSSIKWDAHVRADAGQGWRMDSSGRVSRLLNGSGGTCEREGAGGARPRGTAARAAHRPSHGGSGAGGAGSVRRRGDQGVQLAANVGGGASVQVGESARLA